MTLVFNISDTSSPTRLVNENVDLSLIESIKVDGNAIVLADTYQFGTTGEHKVEYDFVSNTTIPANMLSGVTTEIKNLGVSGEITTIGANAFNGCTGIKSVILDKSVTTTNTNTFAGCSSMKTVTIEGNSFASNKSYIGNIFGTQITKCVFGNDVKKINSFLCAQLQSLSDVTIGNNVTTLSNAAFHLCKKLKSIVLPDSVKTISTNCFKDSGLKTIVIGKGITSIAYWAFGYTGITSVTIHATTPPVLDAGAGISAITTIYVPAEAVDTYKSATTWVTYASNIQAIPE
jgi:hypothetical protein